MGQLDPAIAERKTALLRRFLGPRNGPGFDISKLGRPDVTATVQHVLREFPLALEQVVQSFIKGDKILGHNNRIVDKNLSGLADPGRRARVR